MSAAPGEHHSRGTMMQHDRRSVGSLASASTEAQDDVFLEVELLAASVHRSWILFGVRNAKPQQGPGAQVEKNDLRCEMYNTREPFRSSWETVVWDYDKARLTRAHSVIERVVSQLRGAVDEGV